jgi:hypothetical protein
LISGGQAGFCNKIINSPAAAAIRENALTLPWRRFTRTSVPPPVENALAFRALQEAGVQP